MISDESQPTIVQGPYKDEESKKKLQTGHLERDVVNKS